MHRLLSRQIARASRASGAVDLAVLLPLVEAAYIEADRERARTDRATLLTCEEMDKLNNELLQLAHHDALTGLPNRLLFSELALRAVQRVKLGESLAVLLVDLDRFKLVNDTHGHAMGDALLCEMAARLRASVREVDDVARMGGDEFAIIQIGSRQPQSAEVLAQRLVERLSAPYAIHGQQMVVGASVGIVLAGPGINDVDVLLHDADLALYRAKNEGRSTWRIFEPQIGGSATTNGQRGAAADQSVLHEERAAAKH